MHLLSLIHIFPESEWENCYVTENGQIYVPEDGLSGFEVYQRTMQALAQE